MEALARAIHAAKAELRVVYAKAEADPPKILPEEAAVLVTRLGELRETALSLQIATKADALALLDILADGQEDQESRAIRAAAGILSH